MACSILHCMLSASLLLCTLSSAASPPTFGLAFGQPATPGNPTTVAGAPPKLSPTAAVRGNRNRTEAIYNDFPPFIYIGAGLDMTETLPLDIKSTVDSVLTAFSFFDIDQTKTHKVPMPGLDRDWIVPDSCTVNNDSGDFSSSFESFKNGSEIKAALHTGGSASGRYEVVSGSGALDASLEKQFGDEFQYALFASAQESIQVRVAQYASLISKSALQRALGDLKPFNKSDGDSLRNYKAVFAMAGTHVISEISYGARISMISWAENSNSDVVANFNVDIKAKYNGLVSAGEADGHTKASAQYEIFRHSATQKGSANGGNHTLAAILGNEPTRSDIYQVFLEWQASALTTPGVTSFTTQPLWNIVRVANDPKYSHLWTDIEDAYDYLAQHPATHYTHCRIIMNARFGGLDLISPSAFILPDPASPAPKGTIFSKTKLYYEVDPSILPMDLPTDVTIDFIIKNYSPTVDFGLYHSEEGPPDAPKTSVLVKFRDIDDSTRVNDKPGNQIVLYSKVPVDPRKYQEGPADSGHSSTSLARGSPDAVHNAAASGLQGANRTWRYL